MWTILVTESPPLPVGQNLYSEIKGTYVVEMKWKENKWIILLPSEASQPSRQEPIRSRSETETAKDELHTFQ